MVVIGFLIFNYVLMELFLKTDAPDCCTPQLRLIVNPDPRFTPGFLKNNFHSFIC